MKTNKEIKTNMSKKWQFYLIPFLVFTCNLIAGNVAREFNIYAPPQTAVADRKSFVIVTAVIGNQAVTEVDIIDRDEDGDSDDTYENLELTQGQSYIVFISEGSVNDGYGGTLDGDYFKIQSNRRIQTMIGTNSDWEFDYVPPYMHNNGTSDYFVFIPYGSSADEWRLNVISYKDNTEVTVEDITDSPTTGSGYTSVLPVETGTEKWSGILNEGEDLLAIKGENVLGSSPGGHTFHIYSSDSVSVMVGSLRQAHSGRDGGTYATNGYGINVDKKFYFYLPDNLNNNSEKEIRVNTFSQSATINLYSWDGSSWDQRVTNQSLNAFDHYDYLGEDVGYTQELFKLEASANVAVFTGTYLESGSDQEVGTHDMATYISSEYGYGAGHYYTVFIAPPAWGVNSERLSHVYITTIDSNAIVTIKDMDTDGTIIDETVTLNTNDVYHLTIDVTTYDQMNTGGNRPYLKIYSPKDIRVFDTNWNDNWLAFAAGISVPQYSPQIYSDMPYQRWVFLSFPLELNENNPDSIFGSYFGGNEWDPEPDVNTYWRFSRWSVEHNTYVRWGETDYDGGSHGDPPLPEPGKGYWFYQTYGSGIDLPIYGSEVDIDYPYYIDLDPPQGSHQGLNQVGNPFPFIIDWKNTQVKLTEIGNPSNTLQLTLLQANDLGLIDPWAYRWNGYEYVAYNSLNGGDFLIWDGFWTEQLDSVLDTDAIQCIKYRTEHPNNTHTCIKFHNPKNSNNHHDYLGDDGVNETDDFGYIYVYDGSEDVTITIRDKDNNSETFTLSPSGVEDQLGFRVNYLSKEDYVYNGVTYDRYNFTVSSVNNSAGMDAITYCFGDNATVVYPPNNRWIYVARTSSSSKDIADNTVYDIQLKIPPIDISAKRPVRTHDADLNPFESVISQSNEWFVPLSILSDDSIIVDTHNGFGTLEDAINVYDGYDARNFTPQRSSFADLYFPHDDPLGYGDYWFNRPIKAAYDMQSAYYDTLYWNFDIMCWYVSSKTFSMEWEASSVPGDFDLYLIDLNTPDSTRLDMKAQNSITLTTPEGDYNILHYAIELLKKPTSLDESGIPHEFALSQNYPNPFNAETVINYSIDRTGRVEINVYSITGELVRTLVRQEHNPGEYKVVWNGKDKTGKSVSSGVYLITLQDESRMISKKIILLK